jgi:hypothetical protein
MADRYLIFARDILLSCPILPQMVACSTSLLQSRDREALAEDLAFLTHLVGLTSKLSGEVTEVSEQQSR